LPLSSFSFSFSSSSSSVSLFPIFLSAGHAPVMATAPTLVSSNYARENTRLIRQAPPSTLDVDNKPTAAADESNSNSNSNNNNEMQVDNAATTAASLALTTTVRPTTVNHIFVDRNNWALHAMPDDSAEARARRQLVADMQFTSAALRQKAVAETLQPEDYWQYTDHVSQKRYFVTDLQVQPAARERGEWFMPTATQLSRAPWAKQLLERMKGQRREKFLAAHPEEFWPSCLTTTKPRKAANANATATTPSGSKRTHGGGDDEEEDEDADIEDDDDDAADLAVITASIGASMDESGDAADVSEAVAVRYASLCASKPLDRERAWDAYSKELEASFAAVSAADKSTFAAVAATAPVAAKAVPVPPLRPATTTTETAETPSETTTSTPSPVKKRPAANKPSAPATATATATAVPTTNSSNANNNKPRKKLAAAAAAKKPAAVVVNKPTDWIATAYMMVDNARARNAWNRLDATINESRKANPVLWTVPPRPVSSDKAAAGIFMDRVFPIADEFYERYVHELEPRDAVLSPLAVPETPANWFEHALNGVLGARNGDEAKRRGLQRNRERVRKSVWPELYQQFAEGANVGTLTKNDENFKRFVLPIVYELYKLTVLPLLGLPQPPQPQVQTQNGKQ
jgi:hypothetical protein